MKKILGLDLGSASIGWALIAEKIENERISTKILGMGSRIIPYEGTEGKDFEKGTGESRNAIRTKARTARKGYDRYQLRRKCLVEALVNNNMFPNPDDLSLPKMELWELRNRAATGAITLSELGRLMLWLNQKRGYKSSRSDANLGKKDTEYVAAVKSRHDMIRELNLTIGQYFFKELQKDEYYKVKENIFPREAYIEEFDAICNVQRIAHPTVLSEEFIRKVRNEIIYFQRPLKSQKGLVSVCDFEGFTRIGKDGKEYFVGPKVAPKSSPLFQIAKIWENINNIKITTRNGENVVITSEQRWAIFHHLDNNDKLSAADLLKILELKRDNCFVNKQLEKGLTGNITRSVIRQCLSNLKEYEWLFRLDLNIVATNIEGYWYDQKTGEILGAKPLKFIDATVEQEPFYQLWHIIYSIHDQQECSRVLQKKFNIDELIANKLAALDFTRYAFGNKSVKVIRKILPYLMEGDEYSKAMSYAGYNHSRSITKELNSQRKVLDFLKPIPKNSMRQPIVEKILNQMVNVVNAVIEKYGKPDEIRVELARELKQSKEERNETDKAMNKRQRENEAIEKQLAEYGLRSTRNNIIKWRLYQEIDNDDKKLNAICIYCGQPISLTEALRGNDVDVEHIIPKSKLFDDSQSNKTLAHRRCNKDKNDLTAYDFMKTKPDAVFNEYVERVNNLFVNHLIGKSKRDKLLMTESKIPNNFIDRQLRESQYIAKKAREVLQSICHDVWATTGTITAELRHLWGWDDVTMNLQLPQYKELGLTELVEWESEHGKNKHQKEVIQGWTKRDDHRHHAIDALTIACTKQGFIQRFNTLSAAKTREDMKFEVEQRSLEFNEKRSLLEKYIIGERPINVDEVEKAVSRILISFKAGKKVAVYGTRKIGKRGNKKVVQKNIIVPRGALSEQFVYGRIKSINKGMKIKYLFENPHLIIKPHIKEKVQERLQRFEGDVKMAIASIKIDPIYLDPDRNIILETASCFSEEYVIKYQVDTNFSKVDKVVDLKVKEILQRRVNKFGGKEKEAFKDVQREDKSVVKWYEDEGLVRPIKSVRCYTGLSAVVPVKKDESGKEVGFVKPGNNHHIAIYKDKEGKMQQHICTFWHAVERKKYGLPVIINNSNEVWDKIQIQEHETYPDSFLKMLPLPNLQIHFSMQQNEMFLLNLPDMNNIDLEKIDKATLSNHLYLVWSVSDNDYWMRHHLETKNAELKNIASAKQAKRYYRFKSLNSFLSTNPIKVRLDHLGDIVKIG